MENSNSVQLNINLDTEQGKQFFAAIVAVMGGEPKQVGTLTVEPKQVKAPVSKAPAPDATKVIPFPPVAAAAIPAASLPTAPAPSIPALPTVPVPGIPSAPAAPSTPPAAPKAPSAPAAPKAPAAPAKEPKAPKAPAAPVVPFESLDEEGKREAVKKLTTKWSKKGKTTDVKSLYAAYGAANVESVDAAYLDHFNWAMTTFDTNGQDMAAVLSTFGAQ